ncbi:MAG: hypothetical protein SGPRY_000856 [Prymnesium sp.]
MTYLSSKMRVPRVPPMVWQPVEADVSESTSCAPQLMAWFPHRIMVVHDEHLLRKGDRYDVVFAILPSASSTSAIQRLSRAGRGLIVLNEAVSPPNTSAQLSLLSEARVILTTSDAATIRLGPLFPSLRVRTFPLVPSRHPSQPCAHQPPSKPDSFVSCWSERSTLVFVGAPTEGGVVGLRWLLRAVWPRLRRAMPSSKLHLVGSPQWRQHARPLEGVETHDSFEHLTGLLRSALAVLAPELIPSYQSDAGVIALEQGVPLVTTWIGAGWLRSGRTPGAIAVARSAAEFIAHTRQLHANMTHWQQQQELARLHVSRHLNVGLLQSELRKAIKEALH